MSTSYDYAPALIDSEVHMDCEYYVYKLLRDAVDALESENETLLGKRTCKAVFDLRYYKGINGYCESLYCSECGEPLFREFRACPWCGRRIEVD